MAGLFATLAVLFVALIVVAMTAFFWLAALERRIEEIETATEDARQTQLFVAAPVAGTSCAWHGSE